MGLQPVFHKGNPHHSWWGGCQSLKVKGLDKVDDPLNTGQ